MRNPVVLWPHEVRIRVTIRTCTAFLEYNSMDTRTAQCQCELIATWPTPKVTSNGACGSPCLPVITSPLQHHLPTQVIDSGPLSVTPTGHHDDATDLQNGDKGKGKQFQALDDDYQGGPGNKFFTRGRFFFLALMGDHPTPPVTI